jgi:putative Holliday junction resolvase
VPLPNRVRAETCLASPVTERCLERSRVEASRLKRSGLKRSRLKPSGVEPSRRVRPGVRLAVDVGSVRIGVARCDPGGLLASPLDTVRRGAGDIALVQQLATQNDAIEIVVGLAVGLRGREGSAAADGRDFARRLAAAVDPVPVRLVDERFTTVLAHAALRQGGHDSRARRQTVDMAAAALLLQGALDAERSSGQPAGQLVTVSGGTQP